MRNMCEYECAHSGETFQTDTTASQDRQSSQLDTGGWRMGGQMTRTSAGVALVLAIGCLTLALGVGVVAGTPGGPSESVETPGEAVGSAPVQQTSGGSVSGSPNITVLLSGPTVTRGGESTVTLDLLNSGEMENGAELDPRVTTARGLTLSANSTDTPLRVKTGEVAVGDLGVGAPRSVPLDVVVPEDIEAGDYKMNVTLDYQHTESIRAGRSAETSVSRTTNVTLTVEEGAQFEVRIATTDAPVGGQGRTSLLVANVGEETAREASVSAAVPGDGVQLGGSGSEVFIGDIAPGETRTVRFETTVAEDFNNGAFVFETTVNFRDLTGEQQQSRPVRTGITPAEQQQFSLENVGGTLEVGYSGSISGELVNEGPRSVDEAVLVIKPNSDRIDVGERRYALPNLDAGERTDFQFNADISGQADPGPRQVGFTIEYESGDQSVTDDSTRRIEVAPKQPEFDITASDTTVQAGGEQRVTFQITNQRPEPLTSVNAALFAESPLAVSDDEAFVDRLESGESTEIQFTISASGDATLESHPVEIDFQYDDSRGNERISDVQQLPVQVTEAPQEDSSMMTILLIGGIAAILIVGGVVYYRRQ